MNYDDDDDANDDANADADVDARLKQQSKRWNWKTTNILYENTLSNVCGCGWRHPTLVDCLTANVTSLIKRKHSVWNRVVFGFDKVVFIIRSRITLNQLGFSVEAPVGEDERVESSPFDPEDLIPSVYDPQAHCQWQCNNPLASPSSAKQNKRTLQERHTDRIQ